MKVVLGFSGGVDSAVCAVLLKKAGYEVQGMYMDNTNAAAREDAVNAAETIGIPLKIVDVKAELEKAVCRPFEEAYLRGETPNPCIICNPSVKFKNLVRTADSCGAEFIATGHYARAEGGKLYKGLPANDQSYMLCRLRPEQLQRLILPLGKLEKTQVRALAEEFELPVAHKPDSMEICFIPDKDYLSWLSKRTELPLAGDFIFRGRPAGQHEGICRYTVGQRRPGLTDGQKVYVSRIDSEKNQVELALNEELFRTEVLAHSFNWLTDIPSEPFRANVKVRHTKRDNPLCTVYPQGDRVKIVCDEAVRAPAAGQSAVLYDGEQLLGGGFIE